jgi:hypothetical protein
MKRATKHALVGRGHEREPLAHYSVVIVTFVSVVGAAITLTTRQGRAPRHVPISDLALLGLATARVSRLIAREKATRVIRAPFTRVAPDARRDEVREKPRAETPAMGELVLCPRCVGVWVSAAMGLGYARAPAATRLLATMLSASLLSDLANAWLARVTSPAHTTRR